MCEEAHVKPKKPAALAAHIGDVFMARQVHIDMEDMKAIHSSVVFVVLDDATVARVDASATSTRGTCPRMSASTTCRRSATCGARPRAPT